ncbi:hypothetical protein OPV22_001913 [Ensete ventricosum]|uniref:Uncharacterized protein n=1 Tax=Ensete ventricosum TaxID=4639 RepID=A0AAV8RWK7_ENSVE|nr:hypothetical protein OPV22_001913 [Ensete ventricosum]
MSASLITIASVAGDAGWSQRLRYRLAQGLVIFTTFADWWLKYNLNFTTMPNLHNYPVPSLSVTNYLGLHDNQVLPRPPRPS